VYPNYKISEFTTTFTGRVEVVHHCFDQTNLFFRTLNLRLVNLVENNWSVCHSIFFESVDPSVDLWAVSIGCNLTFELTSAWVKQTNQGTSESIVDSAAFWEIRHVKSSDLVSDSPQITPLSLVLGGKSDFSKGSLVFEKHCVLHRIELVVVTEGVYENLITWLVVLEELKPGVHVISHSGFGRRRVANLPLNQDRLVLVFSLVDWRTNVAQFIVESLSKYGSKDWGKEN